MNRWALAAAFIVLLAGPLSSMAQSEPKNAVEYELFIACPNTTNNQCPIQAWDGADALGAPALAVDPDNVNNMIFASLHGRAASDCNQVGPEQRSRCGQQYTTHTSTNHGASWVDNPFFEPSALPGTATGEHPGIALDPYGHVFISSLYAMPAGNNTWDYVIAAQKFNSLGDINSNQNGNYQVNYVNTVNAHSRIAETWFAYDIVSDKVVLLWNEQVAGGASSGAASDAGESGPTGNAAVDAALDEAASHPFAQPLVGLVEEAQGDLARAQDEQEMQASGQKKSLISWVWTSADTTDPYHTPPASAAIKPCSTSTNPVVSEGWLYVGCKVASGQGKPAWAPDAEPGEIHLFRFRPNGGEPKYLGPSPVSGGEPKLGVRSDGRIAVMTTDLVHHENGTRIVLDGAYGRYDPESKLVKWGELQHYGPQLKILYANMPLVHVNIQDLIYREYSGVITMIFKRVALWQQDAEFGYRPEYFKSIVAIDEFYGVLKEIDLGVGDLGLRQSDATLYRQPVSLYNEPADDFLELPPAPFRYENRPLGNEYQRLFYAVGNYGFVSFAELIEVTELRGPAAAGLPNPPPPPNPAPASASSLALGTAGALTASAVAAGTWTTVKRKSTTGAGRKKQ